MSFSDVDFETFRVLGTTLTKIFYVKLLFDLLTENKLLRNLFDRVKFENP